MDELPMEGLKVDRVSVNAGDIKILKNISFSLRAGDLCAVIGPSGAGKSTLIKTLLGLRTPDTGSVRLAGQTVGEIGPIGYVPQDDAVHKTLTLRQTLQYAIELRRPGLDSMKADRLIRSVAAKLSLDERLDTRIRRLSGGQRKRVSVAIELITDPELLILDEPTSGLDPHLESQLMDVFADLAGSDRVVMVATHAMQSLAKCDVLLILAEGRLVFLGMPGDALKHFQVDTYAGIFGKLASDSAERWVRVYSSSEARRNFAGRQSEEPAGSELDDGGGRVTFVHPSLKRPTS